MADFERELLEEATRTRAFSQMASLAGETFPYGLGWFVQTHRDMKVVWHFGLASESSSCS